MRKTLAFLALFLLAACGPTNNNPFAVPQSTVVSNFELNFLLGGASFTGDNSYEHVTKAQLASVYEDFKKELFRKGIVHGDPRTFDCNRFAGYYVSLFQIWYANATWRSRGTAQAPAVGQYWYHQDSSKQNHAVVVALTDEGLVWLEPQTGQFLELTPAEKNSRFVQIF